MHRLGRFASLVDRALPSTRGDAIIPPHVRNPPRGREASERFVIHLTRPLSSRPYRAQNSLVTIYNDNWAPRVLLSACVGERGFFFFFFPLARHLYWTAFTGWAYGMRLIAFLCIRRSPHKTRSRGCSSRRRAEDFFFLRAIDREKMRNIICLPQNTSIRIHEYRLRRARISRRLRQREERGTN